MNSNRIMIALPLQFNAISSENLASSFVKHQTAILSHQERLRTSKPVPPDAKINGMPKQEEEQ